MKIMRWKAVIESEWLGYTKGFFFKFSAKKWVKRSLGREFKRGYMEFKRGYLVSALSGNVIIVEDAYRDTPYIDPEKDCFVIETAKQRMARYCTEGSGRE